MDDEEKLGILNINSISYITRLSRKFIGRKFYKPSDPKIIVSFIPGTVIDILVTEGQVISAGDDLMIVDAMKMQNKLRAASRGIIKEINVAKGDKVSKGSVLMEMK